MKQDTGRLNPSLLSKTRLALSISAAAIMLGLGLSQTQAVPLDNTDPPPPTDAIGVHQSARRPQCRIEGLAQAASRKRRRLRLTQWCGR